MSAPGNAEPSLPSPPDSPSKDKTYPPFGLVHLAEHNANNQAQYEHQIPAELPEPNHYPTVHEHIDLNALQGPAMRAGQSDFHNLESPGYGDTYDDFESGFHGPEYTHYPLPPVANVDYGDPEHYGNTPPVSPPALEVDNRRIHDSAKAREEKKPGTVKGNGANSTKSKKPREARPSKKKIERPDDSPIDMPVPLYEVLLDIPLVDAEAYIRRPKELREEEWRNRRDFPKMPRPVNVFLLYRRAVSERAKKYAGVTNHQVVSKVAGASWKNESEEVKDLFNHYAELEKEFHDKAFPDYKFNPKKTQSTKSKGRGKGDGIEESDGDDDPEYTERTSTRKKKARIEMKQMNRTEQGGPHTWQYAPQYQLNSQSPIPNPLPYPTNPRYVPHGGYPEQVHTGYDPGYDIGDFQATPQMGLLASSVSTQIGLPGGNHDLLLGHTGLIEHAIHFDANALDPNLFSFETHDGEFFTGAYNNNDQFVPDNLEYAHVGDYSVSPQQPHDWELSGHNTPINTEIEDVLKPIKE